MLRYKPRTVLFRREKYRDSWYDKEVLPDPERFDRLSILDDQSLLLEPPPVAEEEAEASEIPDVSEDDLTCSICKESFFEFVKEMWDTIIKEKPVWNWHIEYLCNELQAIAERVMAGLPNLHDTIINIPPGTTKSTIVSIMLPVWVWTKMPSARFICGSYTHTLALDLARKSRDVLESEKYQRLFPGLKLREDQNTKGHYVNNKGGARLSTASGASAIGLHAHFILIDDPIDPQAVLSDLELREVNRWMNETLSMRKVDKVVTTTILVMQRLNQNDPTGNKLSQGDNVYHICLPAEDTELEKDSSVLPLSLRAKYVNGLLDPVRLPHSVLEAAKKKGEYFYAGQFLQKPVPLGGGMFKIDRFLRDLDLPDKWLQLVRYWDKASTKGGGAFTVGVLMGEDFNERFWVLDVVRGQWESAKREEIIKKTAEADGHKVIIGIEQEPGSGGKDAAEASAKRLAGYRVRIQKAVIDKELRADPFSVQVNSGNVAIKRGAWNKEYISELQYFPFSKYKDQVDASSGAFSLLKRPKVRAGAL